MKVPLIIFGTGAMGQTAYAYFSSDSNYKVVCFAVDSEHITQKSLFGLPVVPMEGVEAQYPPDRFSMFIAVGYSQRNQTRKDKYLLAKERGYKLASYVSSKAIIFDGQPTGDNCFILEGVITQPFSLVGSNVILWCGATICHHAVVGDHSFVAPGAVVCGSVKVGAQTFIGANATLRDHIEVGDRCLIGAGAVLLKNLEEGSVVTENKIRFA